MAVAVLRPRVSMAVTTAVNPPLAAVAALLGRQQAEPPLIATSLLLLGKTDRQTTFCIVNSWFENS
jgi:hypothetical protein